MRVLDALHKPELPSAEADAVPTFSGQDGLREICDATGAGTLGVGRGVRASTRRFAVVQAVSSLAKETRLLRSSAADSAMEQMARAGHTLGTGLRLSDKILTISGNVEQKEAYHLPSGGGPNRRFRVDAEHRPLAGELSTSSEFCRR